MTTKRTTVKPEAAPPVAISAMRLTEAEIQAALARLAAMGDGEIAYIRSFRAGDLRHLFPQAAELHPAVELHALFAADGSPLVLADSREAVISGAWNNDLALISVH